jgi:hypothetical protein
MKRKIEILAELEDVPLVAGISNDNVYSVASGYFDTLTDRIVERAQSATFSRNSTYTAPEGYFKSFPQAILQKIKQNEIATELEAVAPLLNKINKSDVYSIPDKYFSNFTVATQKVPSKHTKVIEIHRAKRVHFIWKYAVAACTAGILLLGGGYFFVNKMNKKSSEEKFYSSLKTVDVQKTIASVSDSELVDYLAQPSASVDYLDGDGAATSTLPEDTSDVQDFLKGVSEKDLDNYLDTDIVN